MFGAVRYIAIFLFLIFVFNWFLDRYERTKLDGTWYNENPHAIVQSIKINVRGSSYLVLNQRFADQRKLDRYYKLSYKLSNLGGFLNNLDYFHAGSLKSDILIEITPLSKREIIIAKVDSLEVCNLQKCYHIDSIRENKFSNDSTIFSDITELFL